MWSWAENPSLPVSWALLASPEAPPQSSPLQQFYISDWSPLQLPPGPSQLESPRPADPGFRCLFQVPVWISFGRGRGTGVVFQALGLGGILKPLKSHGLG
jgi:hypothetical protein